MCLAIPGKIVELLPERENLALVDVVGVRRKIDLGLLQIQTMAIPPSMNTIIYLLAGTVASPPMGALQCPEPLVIKGDLRSGPALAHSFELLLGCNRT